jgi:hypothetical protein
MNTSSKALPAASDELLIEPAASLPSHEVAAAATAGAETSAEKEPEPLPTGSAHTHAADDVSTETGPTSPAGDGHVGGGEESSAAADETTTPAVDIDQLQLEGLAPSILERLPIFTPNGAGAQVDQPIPASGVVSAVGPRSRRQSRIVMYVVAAALALFVVAGVAYFAGRSAQASNAPTGQLP